MIRFSPVRPVGPSHTAPQQESVRFGALWDRWRRPEPTLRYDLNTIEGWSGFTPNKTIQELFGVAKTSAAIVIHSQLQLDNLWKKLNLPAAEKPRVHFGDEAVVIVADERSAGSSGQPPSLEYTRTRDELRAYLPRDDRGRNEGTAWYVAKVYNGFLPIEIRRKFGVQDWYVMTARTMGIIYKVPTR